MDPELLQILMGGGGGYPSPMVPPPGMMGGMPAPQGYGDVAPLPQPGPQMMPRPVEPYMTDPLMAGTPPSVAPPMPAVPGSVPTSLGATLDPVAPTGAGAGAMGGAMAAADATRGAAGGSPNMGGMLNALKGIVAPPAPAVQKVSTPHSPQMAKLQGGGVAELLASLGIGPQQAFPGLKLPSTLGQALGG
jgi:hypothetical protein